MTHVDFSPTLQSSFCCCRNLPQHQTNQKTHQTKHQNTDTIWVFPKIMVPQNGWFMSWKILWTNGWFEGTLIFGNNHISIYASLPVPHSTSVSSRFFWTKRCAVATGRRRWIPWKMLATRWVAMSSFSWEMGRFFAVRDVIVPTWNLKHPRIKMAPKTS